MPRWLYLLLKPLETIAIGVLIASYFALPLLLSGWLAVVLYVGIGLGLWYKGGIHRWLGPGSFSGDILYHGILSIPAPICLSAAPAWAKIGLTVACLLLWWQLDTAGYGPMRASADV